MKRFLQGFLAGVLMLSCLVVTRLALATPSSADQLIALGVQPPLAKKLVEIVNNLASPFSNNTWVTVRNAANSGNINMLKVDGTDDTNLNADTGDVIKFSVAGTTELTLDDDKLTFSGASAKIVPGATSLLFRNNADSASNIAIADAGTVTTRAGITATTGDITSTAGSFVASASGQTLALQEATAGAKCMGSLTCNGASDVTTSTTCATTGSRIFLTRTSLDADTTGDYYVKSISDGVSFTVACETSDTATLNWIIFHEAA